MSKHSVYFLVKSFLWVILCIFEVQPVSLESTRTYYDTLDIQQTATDRQVKKAFHKLAVKYHPDKNKSSDAEKKFREIAEAYEVLSDQETRRMYDSLGHEDFLENEKEDPGDEQEETLFHFNFDDFFSSLDGDDEFFLDEPHNQNQWSEFDDPHEDQEILDNILFDLHDHYFYGHEDEDEHKQFC